MSKRFGRQQKRKMRKCITDLAIDKKCLQQSLDQTQFKLDNLERRHSLITRNVLDLERMSCREGTVNIVIEYQIMDAYHEHAVETSVSNSAVDMRAFKIEKVLEANEVKNSLMYRSEQMIELVVSKLAQLDR